MSETITERCIYCGENLFYSPEAAQVKCVACGKIFAVTRFQSNQAKIRAALKEGEAAKAALAEAEAEKQDAQQRLNDALSALGGLQAGQANADARLARLLEGMAGDRQARDAMARLLEGLKAGQDDSRNVLSRLMQAYASGQTAADAKLADMQALAGKILDGQVSIESKLQLQLEIAQQVKGMSMTAHEKQKLLEDFIQWSQSLREEDVRRLEAVQSASGALLEGQRRLDGKVDRLQQTANDIQSAIEGFQGQYEKDRLDELNNLYRQAERLQRDRAFDKAADAYRQVIVKGGADAEVYWRLVLCHYCIEYQRDDEGNLIPTLLNPDLTDPAEMSVRTDLVESLPEGPNIYAEELRRIDRILDGYRRIHNQVQYDIFISVKQTRDGHTTEDSDKASDLYDLLRRRGFRVFNSRRTQIPAGQEYEPYIISALLSARLLIVVGTGPENMSAQWVRNEWSRFQWLQRRERLEYGRTDRVLICYLASGMKPGQIPRALNPSIQAIQEGVNAGAQLEDALRRTFPERTGANPSAAPGETAEQAIGQMTVWLYAHDFDAVREKYRSLTKAGRFLDRAEIHLCALCARRRVEDLRQLAREGLDVLKEPEYRAARKLALLPADREMIDALCRDIQNGGERHNDPPLSMEEAEAQPASILPLIQQAERLAGTADGADPDEAQYALDALKAAARTPGLDPAEADRAGRAIDRLAKAVDAAARRRAARETFDALLKQAEDEALALDGQPGSGAPLPEDRIRRTKALLERLGEAARSDAVTGDDRRRADLAIRRCEALLSRPRTDAGPQPGQEAKPGDQAVGLAPFASAEEARRYDQVLTAAAQMTSNTVPTIRGERIEFTVGIFLYSGLAIALFAMVPILSGLLVLLAIFELYNLCTLRYNKTLRFERRDGALVCAWANKLPSGMTWCLAVDGRWVASGFPDSSIRLTNVPDGALVTLCKVSSKGKTSYVDSGHVQ